jgi:hypothetical protein
VFSKDPADYRNEPWLDRHPRKAKPPRGPAPSPVPLGYRVVIVILGVTGGMLIAAASASPPVAIGAIVLIGVLVQCATVGARRWTARSR